MINLFVESYCQNCPYFEPVAEKEFEVFCTAPPSEVHTEVHCKDMNKCNSIHNQIMAEEAIKKVRDLAEK